MLTLAGRVVLILAVVLCLGLPAAAEGATLSQNPATGNLEYRAPDDASRDSFDLAQDVQIVFVFERGVHESGVSSATCTVTMGGLTTDTTASCGVPAGRLVVSLGPGDDVAHFNASDDNSARVTTPTSIDGGPGNDVIRTGRETDQITGGPGSDFISANNGPDTIDGGGGFDEIEAGANDDVVNVRDGGVDRVQCGAGNDTVVADTVDVLQECETVDASNVLESDRDRDRVPRDFDCADTDPAIHPGAADVPDDGVDQDCDGQDARVLDRDGDTFAVPLDCNDGDPAIHPGTAERYGNTVDENCDGTASPYRIIYPGVSTTFLIDRGSRITRVRKLKVSLLAAGTLVKTTCQGRGCPAGRTVTTKKTGVDLTRALRSARLRPGATLVVLLTRPDSLETRLEFTAKASSLPTLAIVCRRPGSPKKLSCSPPA